MTNETNTALSSARAVTERLAGVRLVDVSAGYRGRTAVTGVSVDVPAGAWLSIIGPNGAGKSTLLKAIVGVLPSEGRLEIDGVAKGEGSSQARSIGYVPQSPTLPPGMTTAEYALLGRTAHLGWFGSESAVDRRRVAGVLERLGLAALAARPVTELSGGEGQRAALARALVQEASILVLDEPTSALDLAHQIDVLELLEELRNEHDLAIITAMHDLSLAGRFSDELLFLAEGATVAVGPPTEVLTEKSLSIHYKTPIRIMEGPNGELVVVPLRTATKPQTGKPTKTEQQQPDSKSIGEEL